MITKLRVSHELYMRIKDVERCHGLKIVEIVRMSLSRWFSVHGTFDNVDTSKNKICLQNKHVDKRSKKKMSTSHVIRVDIPEILMTDSKRILAILEWRLAQIKTDVKPAKLQIKPEDEKYKDNLIIEENNG